MEQDDEKVLAMISLMIEDDQIQHVRNCLHARDAWQALKDFQKRDAPDNKVSKSASDDYEAAS